MDKLVIIKKIKKQNYTGWKPLAVRTEIYDRVDEIAKDLEITKGELTTELIGFALAHLEIKEENDE